MAGTRMAAWPGMPFPFGAIWGGEGVNFGLPIRDDNFILLFNAHYEDIDFPIPEPP